MYIMCVLLIFNFMAYQTKNCNNFNNNDNVHMHWSVTLTRTKYNARALFNVTPVHKCYIKILLYRKLKTVSWVLHEEIEECKMINDDNTWIGTLDRFLSATWRTDLSSVKLILAPLNIALVAFTTTKQLINTTKPLQHINKKFMLWWSKFIQIVSHLWDSSLLCQIKQKFQKLFSQTILYKMRWDEMRWDVIELNMIIWKEIN